MRFNLSIYHPHTFVDDSSVADRSPMSSIPIVRERIYLYAVIKSLTGRATCN